MGTMQTLQNKHQNTAAEEASFDRRASFPFKRSIARWARAAALTCALVLTANIVQAAGSVDSARSGRDAFLRAIAEVETGNNPRKVGRLGERGQYQFRQATWGQHTKHPFRDAHNPAVAHAVASRHYDWILQQLERSGKRATPYMVAAAWNSGIGRVTSGRIPTASKDYAQRVVNLASSWSPAIRAASITGSAVAVAAN
jgi:hypothetical protein